MAVACLCGLAPYVAHGQLVRGTIVERATGEPLAGVLVELLDADGGTRGSALSDARGAYGVRVGAPGPYMLTAKRIGVRRFRSERFDLGSGETVVRDIALETVGYALPEVVVTALRACAGSGEQGGRIAALWEEARTALLATRLSLRDSLFTAHVTRYVRELEPRTFRVVSEYRSEVRGVVARPFHSIDPESLSALGYVQRDADGASSFYGPDAEVLLSDAFLRDHCFHEVRGQRQQRGLVGLAFRPVRDSSIADILGTMWLDERTFELRLVQFGYNRVDSTVPLSSYGGEVHFARLASGAWVVRRWFIRLPQATRAGSPIGTRPGGAGWMLVRPVTVMLREEGGDVAASALGSGLPTGVVRGTVTDSARRPVPGAVVRVSGSRLAAVTDAHGAFTIDSVPAGRQQVLANLPGYDSLGVIAADAYMDVLARDTRPVSLRALGGRALYGRLCFGGTARRGFGALRVLFRSVSGDSVVRGLPMKLSWDAGGGDVVLDRSSDDRGSVLFCEVPAGIPVRIGWARVADGTHAAVVTQVPAGGARGLMVTVEGNRP